MPSQQNLANALATPPRRRSLSPLLARELLKTSQPRPIRHPVEGVAQLAQMLALANALKGERTREGQAAGEQRFVDNLAIAEALQVGAPGNANPDLNRQGAAGLFADTSPGIQRVLAPQLFPKPEKRRIVKGADGINRFVDTGKQVFEGVQAPTFEPVLDAQGNVIGQQNTQTREVKSDPRTRKDRRTILAKQAEEAGLVPGTPEFKKFIRDRAGSTSGGNTPSQQANNIEIAHRRTRIRALKDRRQPGETLRDVVFQTTQSAADFGRPNPDFDQFINRDFAGATQRMVGEDNDFDAFMRELDEPAPSPPPAAALPPEPEGPGIGDAIAGILNRGNQLGDRIFDIGSPGAGDSPPAQPAFPARARRFRRRPPAATAPDTSNQPSDPRRRRATSQAPENLDQIIEEARRALADGAPEAKVKKRLRELGVDPGLL